MDSPRLDRARPAALPALAVAVAILCGLVGVLAGCVAPSYDGKLGDATLAPRVQSDASSWPAVPSDGQMPDAQTSGDPSVQDAAVDTSLPRDVDGAPPATPTPPAWAGPLLGQYAVRARFFARGTGLLGALNQLKSEWILLGTFSFDASLGKVHLSTKICSATGDNSVAGAVASVAPLYPETLPSHEYSVRSENNEWFSEGDSVPYGFQKTPLVSCEGMAGARVKGADQQRWLKDGQCLCPSTSALPITVDDCRVDDVDGDRQPGATVGVVGAINTHYYVRLLDSAEFVHGQFDSAGAAKSAKYAQNTDQRQLGCSPEPCPSDDAVPCDPSSNPVSFARLGGAAVNATFTCTDVLQGVATLFPSEPLTFPPSGC